jgi:restriction system protein
MDETYKQLMAGWRERVIAEDAASGRDKAQAVGHEDDVVSAHQRATEKLREELLGRIYAQSHGFFEHLIIDVLLAMGYGGRRRDLARRLGRSGDGGIDGIIEQDELGLDAIYLQAKRLKPGTVVPVSGVRDFAGSLEARRSAKGVFVTTAHFSPAATEFVRALSRRIVLVNGTKLTDLMIRYNIGVSVKETFQFKRIDGSYFDEAVRSPRSSEITPASSQPRR